MPSLKVDKSRYHDESTYNHFYEDLTVIERTNCSFIDLAKYLFIIIGINISIYTITHGVWYFGYYRLSHFYQSNNLYFGYISVYMIDEFLISALIIYVFFNQHSKHKLGTILIVSFVVFILISGTILLWLTVEYHLKNHKIYVLQFVCDLNVIKYHCTHRFSLFFLSFYCFYQPMSLLLAILINHCNFQKCCNDRRCKNSQNDHSIKFDAQETQTTQSGITELAMSDIYSNIFDLYENGYHITQQNLYSSTMPVLMLFVGFCAAWMLFLCTFYILLDLNISTQNLTYYFYGLLSVTSIFKLILKYIARHIDIVRQVCFKHEKISKSDESYQSQYWAIKSNNDKYSNVNVSSDREFIHFVSLEIIMEFVVNLFYYYNYYYYFILELSLIDETHSFVEITIMHVFTEVCQSTVRFSKYYFYCSKRIIQQMKHCSKCNWRLWCCCFRSSMDDDSSFDEWRTRHSIDMSMRVISMISSFVNVITIIIAVGYKNYGMSNVHQYYRGLRFYAISFSVDIGYYLVLFLVHKYLINPSFNIWKPFLRICASDFRIIVVMFVIGFGSLSYCEANY